MNNVAKIPKYLSTQKNKKVNLCLIGIFIEAFFFYFEGFILCVSVYFHYSQCGDSGKSGLPKVNRDKVCACVCKELKVLTVMPN